MTTLQLIGCLVFNVRHYDFIVKNIERKNESLSRLIFVLLMTYLMITNIALFGSIIFAKTIFDLLNLFIKFEASGVPPREYKSILIADAINILSLILFIGG